MAKKNTPKTNSDSIALNKKARHDYFIEDSFEAGITLEGWEVKSLRAGKAQITESYVTVKNNEIWLFGANISPLPTVSTHFIPDPKRTRKLLLHRNQIDTLIGHVERKGYTLVPLKIYWTRGKAKVEVGLAKGKKQHDKRASLKEKEWQRNKNRVLKQNTR